MRERLGMDLNIGMMFIRASPNSSECAVLLTLTFARRRSGLDLRSCPLRQQQPADEARRRSLAVSTYRFISRFFHEMVDNPDFATGKHEWDQGRFNRMARVLWSRPRSSERRPSSEHRARVSDVFCRWLWQVRAGQAEGPRGAAWVWGYNHSLRIHVLDNRLFADGCAEPPRFAREDAGRCLMSRADF